MDPDRDKRLVMALEKRSYASPEERELFELPDEGPVDVQDLWLEVKIEGRWWAAFRLSQYAGRSVVSEIRLFPADEWPERQPGCWRAGYLGLKSKAFEAKKELPEGCTFPKIGRGLPAQLLRKVPFKELRETSQRLSRELVKYGDLIDPAALTGFEKSLALHLDAKAQEPLVDWLTAMDLGVAGFRGEQKSHGKSVLGRGGRRPDLFYAKVAAAYVAFCDSGSRRPNAETADRSDLTVTQVRDAVNIARKRGLLWPARAEPGIPSGRLTEKAEALLEEAKNTDQEGE